MLTFFLPSFASLSATLFLSRKTCISDQLLKLESKLITSLYKIKFLVNYFGGENIIEINKEEMYNMNSNIFSISEDVIISEKGFIRLNNELRKRRFIVEEVPYAEIAKMEGLLRCSTMPLIRE